MNFKRVLPNGDNDPERAFKIAKLDNIPIIAEDKGNEIDSDDAVGFPQEEEKTSSIFSKIVHDIVIIEGDEEKDSGLLQ